MAKPKHYHHPILAWKIDRQRLYAKLGALGGMADHANTKIRPGFNFQGKLSLNVGNSRGYLSQVFEVRVWPVGFTSILQRSHRVHVRCPRCHAWTPFGRLHQHILSRRCLATADVANRLPPIPSVRVSS